MSTPRGDEGGTRDGWYVVVLRGGSFSFRLLFPVPLAEVSEKLLEVVLEVILW